ncbi:MAG: hypothetical protein ACXABY_17160 [Candidatus Thorarchaeota archaeon]|jgi:hypothetical protein
MLDWDLLAELARDTGRAICIGVSGQFSRREKAQMSREAQARNLNISMGDHKRDPSEEDDELYVMAKL